MALTVKPQRRDKIRLIVNKYVEVDCVLRDSFSRFFREDEVDFVVKSYWN